MNNHKIQLEVGMDTRPFMDGVDQAKAKLQELGAASEKAGEAASKGITKIENAAQNVVKASEKAAAAQKALESAQGQSADKVEKLAQKAAKAQEQLSKAQQVYADAQKEAFASVSRAAEAAERKVDSSTRAMLASIQRSTAALKGLGQGSEYARLFSLAEQRGQLNDPAIKSALDQFQQLEKSMQRGALTSREMSFALRSLPAQFTDIAVSLQGGQNPLTVFLQQGGQLKDMFGGVGNAASAMAGYLRSLVTPFSVAATAVGSLAIAYEMGRRESEAFAKALILTGNAAGKSVGQLNDMAKSLAGATGSTQGGAADALERIAAGAKIASQNVGLVADAAIRLNRSAGVEIDDTVKQFEELAKSPVEAAVKLNETYNFLTTSVYEQIKALEDQGKTTEAARVATEAYANSLIDKSAQIEETLGYVQRAWRGITDTAKGAWDAMLNVGRPKTLDDLKDQLQNAINTGATAAEIANLEAQIAAKEAARKKEGEISQEKAKQNELVKAQIAWDKEAEKYLDKKVLMEREIAKVRELGTKAGKDQVEIEKQIAAIREKYKDKSTGSRGKSWAEVEFEFQTKALADMRKVMEEEDKLRKDRLKAEQEWNQEYSAMLDKSAESARKEADSIKEKADAAEYEIASIGKTAEELEYLIAKRYDEQIAIKQAELERIGANQERQAEIDAINEQINALERLKNAEVTKPRLQAQARAWENFARDIEQSLTDALMRSFEAGDSFGEAFAKNLQNTFKSMILKVAVQAVVSPVMSGMQSLLGIGQAANTAGGLMGSASGLFNGVSALNSLSMASGVGTAGSGLYGAFATSSIGQSLGLSQVVPGLMGPTTTGAALGSATAGGATLTSVGAAMPYIAAAVAVASMLAKQSTPHVGGLAFGSETGFESPNTRKGVEDYLYASSRAGARTPLSLYNFTENDWFGRENQQVTDSLGKVSQSLAQQVNAITRMYGAGSGYQVGLAYSADGDDGSRGRFGIIKDGEIVASSRQRYAKDMQKGMEQFLSDVPSEILEGLREFDLSPLVDVWLDKSKTATGDLLEGMADQQANAILGALQAGWLDDFLEQMDVAAMSFEDVTAEIMRFSQVASLKPIFDALEIDIYEMGNALADAFGGAQNAATALGAYYEGYYTDAERVANVSEQIAESFADLDLEMPATRAEFRKIVESLDLTTESGKAAYAQLINLAPAFGVVADAAAAAADAAAKAAADAENRQRQSSIRAAEKYRSRREQEQQAAIDAVDSAYGALERAINAQRDVQLEALNAAQEIADRARRISTSLADAVRKLRGQDEINDLTLARARKNVQSMIVSARGGQMPDEDEVSRTLQTLLNDSPDRYKTLIEYERAQRLQAVQLESLNGLVGSQEDAAKKAVELAQAQLDALEDQLETAREQIDALRGIDDSVLSVADAIEKLTKAFGKEWSLKKPGQPVPPITSSSSVMSYGVGTSYVPRDMLAQVHKGERIIPAADNRALMDALKNGSNVIDITPLLAEIAALRAEVKAGQGAIASNTRQTKDLLDSTINGSNTLRTEAVA